jgi:hypothetical protein
MNIFEILASGNRILREEHVSSTFAWLLDPYHDHGLGFEVLKRVVTQAFPGSPLLGVIEAGEYSGLAIRDRGQLETVVELEKEVNCDGHNRSIDILISIGDKYLLAIENKTSDASMQRDQVREEATGLFGHEDRNGRDIYFIYLVPVSGKKSAEQKLKTIPQGIQSKVITWSGPQSIVTILQEILADDSLGKISAISTESVFILKSFTRFATNGFTYFQGTDRAPSTGGEYDKIVQGYLEVVELQEEGFIGYYGGVGVLKNDLEEARTNPTKRQRLLSERPFKWVINRREGHTKENWIPIAEIIKIFTESGVA